VEEVEYLPIGTLIRDMGRIGVITRVIQSGALDTGSSMIKWRINYEIIYADGSIAIIGFHAFSRLIISGMVQIL
tara:strand:+ start:401 stop:622 length:222 start_codon:yes stop_codon:yes gene_type:complete